MAVVKANAYGHGVGPLVKALAPQVELFGVANLQEAREIAPLVAADRIQILGPALPAERIGIAKEGFVPALSSLEEAAAYSALAGGGSIPVLLAIDTGMGRMGIWQADALEQARAIAALPGVAITSIASHLPVADEDEPYTNAQLARFDALVSALKSEGIHASLQHIANSAGLIAFPGKLGNLVRAGLSLYGIAPRPEFQSRLMPVLAWKTRITLVREVGAGRSLSYGRTFITPHAMRVATLGVGYADGYQRHLSGSGAEVLICGQRCAVLGRVTMDQILADVSAVPGATVGEEVVLIGAQGSQEILASELAHRAGTIPWEIFTGIGHRVERVVLTNDLSADL